MDRDPGDALTRMTYAWNDIERTLASDDAVLSEALAAAYSVEALFDYNDFNDECTYFVIRFDVHDDTARAAAAVAEQKRHIIGRAIRQHSQPWHSRDFLRIEVAARRPPEGEICGRQGAAPPAAAGAIASASHAVARLNSPSVITAWQKCLTRVSSDPEGAITSARSLLESTLKTILEDLGEPYKDGADLPVLYRQVASRLRLAPGDHSEQAFKQILSGCQNIVTGLGTVRNRDGDAHAPGRKGYRATTRHAQLAVNAAGTVASFLIATAEHRATSDSPPV
jgi:hypothetical protein